MDVDHRKGTVEADDASFLGSRPGGPTVQVPYHELVVETPGRAEGPKVPRDQDE